MSTAIIETSGNGNVVHGAWVAEQDQGAPDVAFVDEIRQLMAEQVLGEAADEIAQGSTWEEFLHNLFQRQDHVVVRRIWIDDWQGTPEELLAAAREANAQGLPLVEVGRP